MHRLGLICRGLLQVGRPITTAQRQALRGTVKPYGMHVLIAAGSSENWAPKAEQTDEWLGFVAQLSKEVKADIRVSGYEGAPVTADARDILCFPAGLVYRSVRRQQVEDVLRHAAGVVSQPEGPVPPLRNVDVSRAPISILVCAHGSRDERCGKCGGGLVTALRQTRPAVPGAEGVFVLPTTHIGGHEYAANAVIYGGPCGGDWYGHLAEGDAEALLRVAVGAAARSLLKDHWRGKAGWSSLGDPSDLPDNQASQRERRPRPPGISLTMMDSSGQAHEVESPASISLLALSRINGDRFPLEGACGGKAACSTCHVILDTAVYSKLPPPSEAEEDMLDQLEAEGLRTPTSRLGCQVRVADALHGATVRLPAHFVNLDPLSQAL